MAENYEKFTSNNALDMLLEDKNPRPLEKEEPEEIEEPNEVYFQFLERLRKSGVTNMFGAAPYLEDTFDLSQSDARKILSEWMKRYSELSKKYGWRK